MSPHAVQPAPSQEAEPSTTPTAELEARAAHAMSTPQNSLRQSPGDVLGPTAEFGASPLPLSQLISGGTTPKGTAACFALHPVGPIVDDAGPEAGINLMEKKVALDCPDGRGARPEQGQAQSRCGPMLDFSPDPVPPAPAASPDTISSTERMSTSPCALIPLSQDLDGPGPVVRMISNLDTPS